MSFMAQPIRDKKSGIFYTRVSVPLDIKDAFGRSEVKRSLRTRDPKEAAKLHAIQYAEFMAEFDAFRRRQQTLNTNTSKPKHAYDELTRFDVAILAARFYNTEYEKIVRNTSYGVDVMAKYDLMAAQLGLWSAKTEALDDELLTLVNRADNHPVEWEFDDGQTAVVYYPPAKEVIQDNVYHTVLGELADNLLKSNGFNVSRDSKSYGLLLIALASRIPKLQAAASEAFSNNFDLSQADKLADNQTSKEVFRREVNNAAHPIEAITVSTSKQVANDSNYTILDAFNDYCESERHVSQSKKSLERRLTDYKTAIERFSKFLGGRSITTVTRADIASFRELLLRLPSRANGSIKGLPLEEQAKVAERDGLDLVSVSSVKKQLSAISAVFSYVIDKGLIDINPVHGSTKRLSAAIEKRAGQEKQYTNDELHRIFNSAIYLDGYRGERALYGEAVYWLPLLAYYTGARIEELAQLYVQDLACEHGVYYLHICDDREDKSVKNRGSKRNVPLHNDLIKLGFLSYVDSLTDKQGRIFNALKRGGDGRYSQAVSKWITSYFREALNVGHGLRVMHAFRHTTKTLARVSGIPEDVSRVLMGHSSGNVADSYGHYPIELLKHHIDKLPSAPLTSLAAKK